MKTQSYSLVLLLSLTPLACVKPPEKPLSLVAKSQVAVASSADETAYSEDSASEEAIKKLEEESVNNPFTGCGYDSFEGGDAADIGQTDLASTPSQAKGSKATVFGNGKISMSGTQSNFKTVTDFQVTSTSPNNAKGKAEEFAKKASSTTEYTALAQKDVQAALQGEEGGRPLCGFLMANASSSKSVNNETFVKIAFDKPVIFMMNPKLSPERLKLELAVPVVIEDVTATIDSNEDKVNEAGKVRKGQVEVSLINPTRKVIDSMGLSTSIKAQVAYRVSNKFDPPEGKDDDDVITQLNQITDYYIQDNKVTHVVITTPRFELKTIVFIGP